MSNRFFHSHFIQCGKCLSVQRLMKGYQPIPDPIHFNSAQHCSAFHAEQRQHAGFLGTKIMELCSSCKKLHGDWDVVDFQTYLKGKRTR